jgi:hypothetical protein
MERKKIWMLIGMIISLSAVGTYAFVKGTTHHDSYAWHPAI